MDLVETRADIAEQNQWKSCNVLTTGGTHAEKKASEFDDLDAVLGKFYAEIRRNAKKASPTVCGKAALLDRPHFYPVDKKLYHLLDVDNFIHWIAAG